MSPPLPSLPSRRAVALGAAWSLPAIASTVRIPLEPADLHVHDAADITTGMLSDARLPERLGPSAKTIADWNLATQNGWYMGSNILNQPEPGNSWFMGFVEAHNSQYTTQTVHQFTADASSDTKTWRRSQNAGTWSNWYRMRLAASEQDAEVDASIGKSLVSTGTTNHTSIVQAFIDDLANGRDRGGLRPGRYFAEGLVIPNQVILEGWAGETSRYGTSPDPNNGGAPWYGSVVIQRPAGSTSSAPIITVAGAGAGLRNIMIKGNGVDNGAGLVVQGFESMLDTIRVMDVNNTAIDAQRINNNRWRYVYVDVCGTLSLPAVHIWSKTGAGQAGETNNWKIDTLRIERCKNVHLNIAHGTDATQDYAEFGEIRNLHVEAGSGGGGLSTVDPAVLIGNLRGLDLWSPMILGGAAIPIRYEKLASRGNEGEDGLRIFGGSILSQKVTTGEQAMHLLDLVSGDDFAAFGTRFMQYGNAAIWVKPTFGPRVHVDPSCTTTKVETSIMRDDRTNAKRAIRFMNGGHLEVKSTPPTIQLKGSLGVSPPTPSTFPDWAQTTDT